MATETVFANADIENQHGNTMGSEKTEAYTLGSPTTTFVDSQASEIENVDPDGEEMPFLKENQDRSDIVQASNPQRLSRWVARIYKMIPWLQKPWHTEVRSLQQCRRGYPRLAAFMDSDENFMMYRRFGYIQARLLLDKQNEIQQIEKELDMYDDCADEEALGTGETDDEDQSYRKQILKKAEAKFREYASLLQIAKETTSMRHPTTSEYRSLRNLCHYEQQLSERDEAWVKWKEDMVTLRPGRDHAWLDTAIETALRLFNCKLTKFLFRSKETSRKSNGPQEYFTRSRIQGCAAGIIAAMVLVLLIIPTYVLYHLTNDMKQNSRVTSLCIGVLLVFTLAFSAVLSLFTRAKRHEILAAAAAYCAVLVVFLGNVPRPA